MTIPPAQHAARLRNHWWPRPGWRPGRDVYTWHLTFDHDHAAELHRLTAAYQQQLISLPGLNLVPIRWLHLTLQAVGWADETSADDLDAVTHTVQARVADLPQFELTFTRPVIRPEAIVLHPQPAEPVHELLDTVRAGIAGALGDSRVTTSTEQTRGFRPHVSLAYSASANNTGPYIAALDDAHPAPATVPITHVDLIRQQRLLAPDRLYRWTTEASAQLV